MQFDFQLGPGASQTIDVRGRFFKYKSGNGPIRIRTSLGGAIELMPGQGVEDVNFTSLSVVNLNGGNNAGVILAGEFNFRDETITGTVDVVDGGYARTLLGEAFMGVASIAADPAKVCGAEVWNPVGNTKNLIVKRYTIASTAGGQVHVRLTPQMLAQVNNNGYAKNPMIADSAAQMRVGQLAQVSDYFFGNKVDQTSVAPASADKCVLQEPLMVPPGWGVLVHAIALNVDVTVALEWHEERI